MAEAAEKWLVSFDTDRIKNYIFATNSLKEIRGASAILVEQDEKRAELLPEADRVYLGGGGGAGFCGSEYVANKLIQTIELDFRLATRTGTITAVALPPEANAPSTWFGRRMAAASKQLKRVKAGKAELGLLPVEPFMRLCDSCGHLPAETRLDPPSDLTGSLLCASCATKRERGWELRWHGYGKLFLQHARQFEFWQSENLQPPADLNALGELDGTGYVGFVAMDGNRMGRLLELMATPAAYGQFSRRLKDMMTRIIFEVLATKTRPIKGKLPFEIVLIGGDDVMIFTTATFAMTFAVEVMRRFEAESFGLLDDAGLLRADLFDDLRQAWAPEEPPITAQEPFYVNRKLTMAAGVAICHSNFPAPALVEIGEALQKNAKKKCGENRGTAEVPVKYEQGAIDFQVITGSAIDLDWARAEVPHNRPYLLSDMTALLDFARRLRREEIPRTQLQMVYDACHQPGRAAGTIATLHLLGRLRDQSQQELFKDVFARFCGGNGNFPTQWPWVKAGTDGAPNRTALVDLLDLLEFTQ